MTTSAFTPGINGNTQIRPGTVGLDILSVPVQETLGHVQRNLQVPAGRAQLNDFRISNADAAVRVFPLPAALNNREVDAVRDSAGRAFTPSPTSDPYALAEDQYAVYENELNIKSGQPVTPPLTVEYKRTLADLVGGDPAPDYTATYVTQSTVSFDRTAGWLASPSATDNDVRNLLMYPDNEAGEVFADGDTLIFAGQIEESGVIRLIRLTRASGLWQVTPLTLLSEAWRSSILASKGGADHRYGVISGAEGRIVVRKDRATAFADMQKGLEETLMILQERLSNIGGNDQNTHQLGVSLGRRNDSNTLFELYGYESVHNVAAYLNGVRLGVGSFNFDYQALTLELRNGLTADENDTVMIDFDGRASALPM